MKKILIIGIALFLLTCSKSDDDMNTIQEEKTIVGNWKLVEIFSFDGIYTSYWYSDQLIAENNNEGFPRWLGVFNGYTYTFKANGNFITDRDNCFGEYNINDSTVSIVGCNEMIVNTTHIYSLYDNYLELNPENNNCIEGCVAKFIRIDDTNN